jgi:tyrosine-protein kinase Etk/Wzc
MQTNPGTNPNPVLDVLDPKRIVEKVLSNWYLFLGSIILFLGISFFYTKKTTPIYESQGLLLISEAKGNIPLEIFSGNGGLLTGGNASLQNEIVTLQTYSLALETIRKLELNTTYYSQDLWKLKPIYNSYPIQVEINWEKPQLINAIFKLTFSDNNEYTLEIEESPNNQLYKKQFDGKEDTFSSLPEGTFNSYHGKFGEQISTPYFEFTIFNYKADDYEELFFKISDDSSLAKQYKNLVSINPVNKETTALQMKIVHPDRKIGELYINTLMQSFLDSDLKDENEMSQNTLDFIENQIRSVSDSLNEYENELQNYRQINRITNVSDKGSNILIESVKLEDELNQQTSRLEYYQNLKKYLTNPEGQELLVPSLIGIEDPLFNTMVSSLLMLQNEKSGLKGVLSSDSFSYVRELNNKIENLKINLNESIRNAILNISNHIQRLQGMIGVVEKDFNMLPELERNLIDIERRYKLNESIYTYLLQKKAEIEIQKASTITKHQILDVAMINPVPISPKLSRNLALGASLGFTLPLLITIIWLFLNYKVGDPKELEKILLMPILAKIPRESKQVHILDLNTQSPITESFRSIRSSLAIRYNFKDKGTILITSAAPGEGKTFVSIKIASTYAALGKKTLLMGMDSRRPKISSELGIHNNFGVTTYLNKDEENLENLIQVTQQENLEVINAGPYLGNSGELIHSERFESMMRKLKNSYDFIVIDTSPITMVSETIDLTKYSDINFFILRHNYSYVTQSYIANDLYENLGIPNMFVIINDIQKSGLYYSYGYKQYSYSSTAPKENLFSRLFS